MEARNSAALRSPERTKDLNVLKEVADLQWINRRDFTDALERAGLGVAARREVLLFIPGIGSCDVKQLKNVQSHVHIMRSTSFVQVDCLIHSYVDRDDLFQSNATDQIARDLENNCTIAYMPGANYADNVKTFHPVLFSKQSGYDYVLLVLDDVLAPREFTIDAYVRFADVFSLDVLGTQVANPHHSLFMGLPPPEAVALRTIGRASTL